MPRQEGNPENERVERIMFVIVVGVMPLVALLVFFFSFGNVGLLGVGLGVDRKIAFLTGPAIDLSVAGLVIAASYLSSRGWTEKQLWPLHVMAALCGAVMIALNDGDALYEHHWRLAAFDTVGPALLIGWAAIGPWLLRQLVKAKRVPVAAATPTEKPQRGTPAAVRQPQPPQGPIVPQTPAAALVRQNDAAQHPLPQQQRAAAPAPQKPAGPIAPPAAAKVVAARQSETDAANGVTRLVPKDDRPTIAIDLIARHGRDNVSGTTVGDAIGTSRDTGIRLLRDIDKLPDLGERVAEARQRLREAGETVTEDADESDRELVTA